MQNFKALLLLPLGITGQHGSEIGGIDFDLLLLLLLVISTEAVKVVDEEVDKLDFREVLLELVLFLSLLIPLLVLCPASISLLVGDLLSLDPVLPLDIVHQLLLLPVIVLLLVVIVPDLIAISAQLGDLLLQLVQTSLLALLPRLILLIVAFLLLGLF